MGYVKVLQEDLDAIDQSLDESTAAIEQKLNDLNLPAADLAPIMEDLNNLKGLHTPPAEPVVDNTLPGDLPPE
jgi:hypothetical protein